MLQHQSIQVKVQLRQFCPSALCCSWASTYKAELGTAMLFSYMQPVFCDEHLASKVHLITERAGVHVLFCA